MNRETFRQIASLRLEARENMYLEKQAAIAGEQARGLWQILKDAYSAKLLRKALDESRRAGQYGKRLENSKALWGGNRPGHIGDIIDAYAYKADTLKGMAGEHLGRGALETGLAYGVPTTGLAVGLPFIGSKKRRARRAAEKAGTAVV